MQAIPMPVEASGKPVARKHTHLEAHDKRIVPRHVGFEIELGNHVLDATGKESAADAARALVASHHRKSPDRSNLRGQSASEFDGDGFRFYRDHEHAEICSPLVPSAAHLVLAMREARRKVIRCSRAAQDEVGPVRVSYNNTNRHDVAWAFHGNFLVSRPAFNQWRNADWAPLKDQWVPFLVTSLPLVGTGKVGAEHRGSDCPFQFSQRADFMDGEIGLETVASKSLINTRDEPLADPERYARLHVIAWDTNLMEFANWLKFGASQILLALIEEEVPLPVLALKDPVWAMGSVSRDLKLRKRLTLQSGRRASALEVQRRLATAAAMAIDAGCAASQVPDAEQIVRLWLETIDDLETRNARLGRRLDWCAKLNLLRRAQAMGKADRESMLALDLQYAEVGGLFEKLENAGAFDRLEDFVPSSRLKSNGHAFLPREQTRALFVSKFGQHLAHVDWDSAAGTDASGGIWIIPMEDPLGSRELLRVVKSAVDWTSCLDRLIQLKMAHPLEKIAVACGSHKCASTDGISVQ